MCNATSEFSFVSSYQNKTVFRYHVVLYCDFFCFGLVWLKVKVCVRNRVARQRIVVEVAQILGSLNDVHVAWSS